MTLSISWFMAVLETIGHCTVQVAIATVFQFHAISTYHLSRKGGDTTGQRHHRWLAANQ